MTEMLPGAELDILIGENVMGLERVHYDYESRTRWALPDSKVGIATVPKFSEDLLAAWQVVKKLNVLIVAFDFRDGHVTCRMISTKLGIAERRGETEAHAICLTALALMREFRKHNGLKILD